jgi:hypothetical protein
LFSRLCRTRQGRILSTATLLANIGANTQTNPKRHNDELHPTSMLLRLHYSQSENQMLVLFWAPSMKFITTIVTVRVHILQSFSNPPSRNQLVNCIHTLHKFGNPGYCHRSHISIFDDDLLQPNSTCTLYATFLLS